MIKKLGKPHLKLRAKELFDGAKIVFSCFSFGCYVKGSIKAKIFRLAFYLKHGSNIVGFQVDDLRLRALELCV